MISSRRRASARCDRRDAVLIVRRGREHPHLHEQRPAVEREGTTSRGLVGSRRTGAAGTTRSSIRCSAQRMLCLDWTRSAPAMRYEGRSSWSLVAHPRASTP